MTTLIPIMKAGKITMKSCISSNNIKKKGKMNLKRQIQQKMKITCPQQRKQKLLESNMLRRPEL